MAKEKGFYKEKNLEVEIKEYRDNIKLTQGVLNSQSAYGVSKSSVILDALRGKNVVLLSAIYQRSPIVLISLEKSNIKNIKDLKGKRISLIQDTSLTVNVNSMLVSNGIKLEDIKYVPDTFRIEDLTEGNADAKLCFLSNEPYLLEQKGVKYRIHNPSDYGFNFYGGILFTSQKELEENPLRVKKFNEASLKGWRYAFENVEETAKIIFEKYNAQNKTLDALIYEGKVLKDLSDYDKGLLGNIDVKVIEELERVYALLSTDIKLNQDINKFVYSNLSINLTKKEKRYLKNNKIKLLSKIDFPPLSFIDKEHEITGLEIEYFRLFNQKLKNANYEIKNVKNNKEATNIINNDKNSIKYYFSSGDDKNILEETLPLFDIPLALATLKDKAFIPNIADLKNKKVAILNETPFFKLLQNNYPSIKFVELDDFEQAMKKLLDNEVFAIVGKLPRLSYLINKNNYLNLKISGTFKEKYQARLSINKNNKILKDIINKVISTITNEDRRKINSKYYHVAYQTVMDYSWVYKFLLPLLFFLLILIYVNRKLKEEINIRKELEQKLQKMADFDFLTEIYNRKKIEDIFEIEIERAKRYKKDLSVIFFDIDDFKKINDILGHKIGDKVLKELTKLVKKHIRKTDYFGRWGGEEFIVILPETSKDKARNVAYSLRELIINNDFEINKKVTCSFGISQFEEKDTSTILVTRADSAMYDVKKSGKDNVKVN
ncbi:MAG: diguanylate cyclase [Arcobacter sp.]|nr:diguanylate cyclase [Arcobacter sp.]